ncbi:restriction endonuclease subunit S domain-containing protein [Nocardia bovistercoris]|uniref:Restriction endonuclease subunit S n=1 Tax=Nocardia bovistercoris TaxID=2785916 RepID=A0A931N7C6_9NOCA|nr:hypothetical protein [Nocardia bovistercoris]MBH0781642.1 hypothetical protein [Nocardia bovistercoris]
MNAWPSAAFAELFTDRSPRHRGIPRSRYSAAGALPIVDQGGATPAGYTDDRRHEYTGPLPVLVFGDHTRRVKYIDYRFAVGADGVKVLHPRPGFDARYLYHALAALDLPDAGYARHFKFLADTAFPAPPPPVQRRVADLLDRAETLAVQRRTALTLMEELLRTLFMETFGDLDPPHADLDDIADFHSGAALPSGEQFTGQPGGHLLLKVADLTVDGNDIELGAARRWSATPGARGATCPAGCVVIPKRGGAIATNKRRLTTRPVVLDPNLMAIRPHGVELLYLFEWLRGIDLTTLATGSSMPQLNKKDLAALRVPVPPAPVQRAFTRRASVLHERIRTQRAQSRELDALFATLRYRAFTGE